MFVKLNYVGLANIIFEKEGLNQFHKEYLQEFDIDTLINDYKNSNLEKWLKKSNKIREVLKFGSSENVIKLLKN
jgi:lipid-A-disaccharide synthase